MFPKKDTEHRFVAIDPLRKTRHSYTEVIVHELLKHYREGKLSTYELAMMCAQVNKTTIPVSEMK